MRYILLAVVLVSAATLGGCTEGVLDPKGPIAAAERQILSNSLGIMLAIVIPTILATLGVAWWFRSSNERARLIGNMKKEWLAHAKNVGFEPIDLCPRAARARWRGLGFSTSRWECM